MCGRSLSGLAAPLATRALQNRTTSLPHLLFPRPGRHAQRRPTVLASLDEHHDGHGSAPGVTWGTLPLEVEQEQFGWSSAVAQDSTCTVEQATELAVMEALSRWPAGQAQPHLAIVFVSSSYHRVYDRVMPLLLQKLPSLQHVVGCSVSDTCWLLPALCFPTPLTSSQQNSASSLSPALAAPAHIHCRQPRTATRHLPWTCRWLNFGARLLAGWVAGGGGDGNAAGCT